MYDRIRDASPVYTNRRVDTETLAALEDFRDASPSEIAARLRELDEESDVECVSELLATVAAIGAIVVAPNRPALAWAVGGVLGIRAITGWRPLLPLVRMLGYRSRREIEREFHGLKALRGDHHRVQVDPSAKGAMTSAQGEVGVEAQAAKPDGSPSRTPVHGIPQFPTH